jgi:threonyl-tRNA synthetase
MSSAENPVSDSASPADQHQHDHDHRAVAQRLDLMHFQDEAPGMAFWHPAGFGLVRLLEEAARRATRAHGYQEVRTPQILRKPVWEASGHWQHFAGGMFRIDDQSVPAAVKPVSCPGHACLFGRRAPSYRDLPLRFAELGLCHRDEPSGTLHGLMRLRQFVQDDGHIFCASEEQAKDEVLRFCQALPAFYRAFGLPQPAVALSTRPAESEGDDGVWDRSEAALRAALEQLAIPFVVQPGAGAFYGPKIEWALPDRQGRSWQCGTIQFDLVMPRRFGLAYVDARGERRAPVMLHRALYGSLERFLGVVLEHHGANLPHWLGPQQVAVLPVSPAELPAARAFADQLATAGLRAQLMPDESLGKRIAVAHAHAIPFQVVVGAREAAAGTVTLRARPEEPQRALPVAAALAELGRRCAWPDMLAGNAGR